MVSLLISALGCSLSPPSQQSQVLTPIINLPVDQAMQRAEAILGEMHFSLHQKDIQNGFMVTHPLSGAQFFEFWRQDTVGRFNRIESSLHTIRRTVELSFTPVSSGTQIACTVHTERLNLPGRETASPNQAYQILTESSPIVQTLKLTPQQKQAMVWVPLGPDTALANVILRKIAQQQPTQDWRIEVAAQAQNELRNRDQ